MYDIFVKVIQEFKISTLRGNININIAIKIIENVCDIHLYITYLKIIL